LYRGLNYYNLELYTDAINDYSKAIYLDPYYADAYYNRSLIYGILGQTDFDKQDSDKACSIDPSLCIR